MGRSGARRVRVPFLAAVATTALVGSTVVLALGATPAGAATCAVGAHTTVVSTNTLTDLDNAFTAANADASPHTICIEAGVGTFTLTGTELLYDNSQSAPNAGLTISGNGATIDGGSSSGVIDNETDGVLTLDHLTITHGNATTSPGGGVLSLGPVTLTSSTVTSNTTSYAGGGVFSGDDVTVTGSTISGNTANGPDCVCAPGGGGGIYSRGDVTITNSTVSGNAAADVGGGGVFSENDLAVTGSSITNNTANGCGCGGGVWADFTVIATNSTISGNTGTVGGGINAIDAIAVDTTISGNTADGDGGGIIAALVDLVHTTITSNTLVVNADFPGAVANVSTQLFSIGSLSHSESRAGALHAADGSDTLLSFGSVIVTPIGAPNCSGNVSTTSLGGNWDDDGTCGFGGSPNDHSNAGNPMLGALANNGGATQTMLPAEGSGLIDAIPSANCGDGNSLLPPSTSVTTDQRGVARPQRLGCDIGAVEVGPAAGNNVSTAVPCGGKLATVATAQGTLSPLTQSPLPPAPTAPSGLLFSCGLIGFNVSAINIGQSVTITVTIDGVRLGQYWKLQNNVWTQMTVTTAGTGVSFTLTDGGAGDADGVANGVIVDPGAPTVLVSFTG